MIAHICRGLTKLFVLLIVACLFSGMSALAQTATATPDRVAFRSPLRQGPTEPEELEAFLDGVIAAQLEENHVAGATVSVVKDGAVFFAKGYGYADVEEGVAVDPEKTLFHIGSIGKLFTWTAVMQLVEQGKLDLDEDVNTYLDFRIPDTYPEPVTIAHLLAHTPGFEDRLFNVNASGPERLIPIGKWLAQSVPARVRPPGEFAAYSNYGTALAGYIVERVSGLPYDEYIAKNLLQPLGMEHANARQPLPVELAPDISKGYKYVDGAYKAQGFEFFNIAPAGSVSASATDMARFAIAHLQNGRYGGSRLLQEGTAQRMHSQLFTHDKRLNGFAYGFYEMSRNGQRVIGHGGDTLLFHSLLALLPDQNLGLFVSYNSADSLNLPEALFDAFMDRYYPAPESTIEPMADFAERARRFTGDYRLNRSSYTTLEKLLTLLMPIYVRAANDGTLIVSSPYAAFGDHRFVEVEPMVFREVAGDDLLIFRADERGNVTHGFLNSEPMIAAEKLAWHESPTFHNYLLASCIALFLSVIAVAPIGFFIKLGHNLDESTPRPARLARWLLGCLAVLGLVFVIGFVVALGDLTAFMAGDVSLLKAVLIFPVIVTGLTIGAIVGTVLAWRGRYWNVAGRIHYTLVTLAAVAFVWMLNHWHLLGWQF